MGTFGRMFVNNFLFKLGLSLVFKNTSSVFNRPTSIFKSMPLVFKAKPYELIQQFFKADNLEAIFVL